MKITVIGAGAMGGATVEGLVKAGHQGSDICVSDPSQAVLIKFAAMGITTTTDNRQAVQGADIVMVVVKPWLTEQVLKGIKSELNPKEQILIVIAAGVRSASIQEWLGAQCPPLFLCIPNIAIAQLVSTTFIVPIEAEPQLTEKV
ncbi:MAG: NAD(P)-binding domain-containing protein, partial [Prevotella sp.]|nr:NAD(P)-binding domain-containing protein [Prevotella sp.]